MRLRTDLWVAGYIRAAAAAGAFVAVRKKGAPEAGAIFIRVDRLDGTNLLFGPAPQAMLDDGFGDRRFSRLHEKETLDASEIEQRLAKEARFDQDLWIVEIEDRAGRNFLGEYLV